MILSLIPWEVREEHRGTYLHRMLERESLRRDGMPCGTAEDLAELEEWKKGLTRWGIVVEYAPRTRQWFVLVHATEAERGWVIREPQQD